MNAPTRMNGLRPQPRVSCPRSSPHRLQLFAVALLLFPTVTGANPTFAVEPLAARIEAAPDLPLLAAPPGAPGFPQAPSQASDLRLHSAPGLPPSPIEIRLVPDILHEVSFQLPEIQVEIGPQPDLTHHRVAYAPNLGALIRPASGAAQLALSQPPIQPADPLPIPAPPTPRPPLNPAEVLGVPGQQNPMMPERQLLPEDRPIATLTTNIAPPQGLLPQNMASGRFFADVPAGMPRPWEGVVYSWDAPDLCYRPLRYEEVNLERYGYSHCPLLQPAISGAHFFCATLALPYSMTVHPPHECIYPLGHYRPGSPVPYQTHWPEWRMSAAAVEVATVAGLILLIP